MNVYLDAPECKALVHFSYGRCIIKDSRGKEGQEEMRVNYQYVSPVLREKMIQYRREFHRYPEVGWTEYRTSARIAEILESFGYEVYIGKDVCDEQTRMGVPEQEILIQCEQRALEENISQSYIKKMEGGYTGVVGIIRGDCGKNVQAIRFDIDALPVCEVETEKNKTYCSVHGEVMHACGHDGHIAAGLGLAEILSQNREKIDGEIRLIFQPAEEECRGAASIVRRGWLEGVSLFLSGHIGIRCREIGMVAACTGGFLATTKLNIHFHGQASHAANAPEKGRNALLAAAVFTVNAYGISRSSEGDSRLNVGRFISGTGRNIISDSADLEVETRGENEKVNIYMRDRVESIAKAAAQMYDVDCRIDRVGDVGTAKSDEGLIKMCKSHLDLMGIGDKYIENGIFNASEDAVTMMNEVQKNGGKAAYFMFGTELLGEHHQNTFDFNEDVLAIMAETYSRILLKK